MELEHCNYEERKKSTNQNTLKSENLKYSKD
jgi:hypothetical protein